MSTILAWFAVIMLQLYAACFAFRCGQEDAKTGGGRGYAAGAVLLGVVVIGCSVALGAGL